MNQKDDKQIKVGDEINQNLCVEQDQINVLDLRALPNYREQQKYSREGCLNQDRHIRRVPPWMHRSERFREIAIQPDNERDARRPDQPGAHAAEITDGVKARAERSDPPQRRGNVICAGLDRLEKS